MNKKLFLLLIPILLLIGCSMSNTPTSKAEELFTKYQTLDNDIEAGINNILNEQNLNTTHKDRYRKILEKQYKNLVYQIKEEVIDGNTATITTEIEVIDLKKEISNLTFDSTKYTKESYDEEKLKRLESAKDKVKYTLELSVIKDNNNNWRLSALTNDQIKKIQGMY